jgi:hypothetical protein
MKKLLLLLLTIPLTLTAKETDFLCNFKLIETDGFNDIELAEEINPSFRYSDTPDESGDTFLEGEFSHKCEVKPTSMRCSYYSDTEGWGEPPTYGMYISDDSERLYSMSNTVTIDRLDLSATIFMMKQSYILEYFGKIKEFPNIDDYYKAIDKVIEKATWKGSCKVIKQEDLKF